MKASMYSNPHVLNASDLPRGKSISCQIDDVSPYHSRRGEGNNQEKLQLHLNEFESALVLNQTNTRFLIRALGDETTLWVGALIALQVKPVEYQGEMVDGIRIIAALPADKVPTDRRKQPRRILDRPLDTIIHRQDADGKPVGSAESLVDLPPDWPTGMPF